MTTLEKQIEEARRACHAFYSHFLGRPIDAGAWDGCQPDEQNAWHQVVERVKRETAPDEIRLSEKNARIIMEALDVCYSEGQGGDGDDSELLAWIADHYPQLKEK